MVAAWANGGEEDRKAELSACIPDSRVGIGRENSDVPCPWPTAVVEAISGVVGVGVLRKIGGRMVLTFAVIVEPFEIPLEADADDEVEAPNCDTA